MFYNDNFINLMSVMRSAIAKYGRPKVFNFDNGKSYKNKQMELLAARIGTTLSYCQPYTPTGKAKIERWFRTMKDQWMAALDMRDFHSLEELRGSLYAFVQQYNQSPILPSVDCPHRTVSFQNRSRYADFLRKTSVKISFWRLNAGYLLTV